MKIPYKDSKERQSIIDNTPQILVKDVITKDEKYLVFASETKITELTKEEVLEQEIIDLKARVYKLESATQTKEVL